MSEYAERGRANKGPRLLAVKQAIFELGLGRTAIYELIKEGKLKSVTIGRRRLVPAEAIEEFIAALANNGAPR
jgi:excisionase family DNA binding protein